jgi:SAM-dependent methyltransferase
VGSYSKHLEAEIATWVIDNPEERSEKLTRERIRHYGIVKALLLDKLPTHRMAILEVGGGPLPVSDLLPFRRRLVVDPCTESYRTIAPCPDHVDAEIERFALRQEWDLIIATNSLDHVQHVGAALKVMHRALRPGGYIAILCAENNALTHPHPAHEHNITARTIHAAFDADYETVWELDYENDGFRYGWVPFEGKRGQPAFALLMRKAGGYSG